MTKISILTIHSIYNYGSALQSYALCYFLRKSGFNAEIIDYCPNYSRGVIRKLKNLCVKLLFAPKYYLRAWRFRKFLSLFVARSRMRYYKYVELLNDPPQTDIYMVGSDQVWNSFFPCGRDRAYRLCFVNSNNKLSYAASLGCDDVPVVDLELLKNDLSSFHSVSVRELSGKRQLEKVGLPEIQHVVDPVFLLEPGDYKKILRDSKHHKYILVYAVHKDDVISRIARRIAVELGLKIVFVGDFAIRCSCDVSERASGPLEFMSLMFHADYILTSSFHCVAFAIIFKKNFSVILPKVNAERINDILSITGLSSRVLGSDEELAETLKPIDYQEPHELLSLHVENSRKWLLNSIEECKCV